MREKSLVHRVGFRCGSALLLGAIFVVGDFDDGFVTQDTVEYFYCGELNDIRLYAVGCFLVSLNNYFMMMAVSESRAAHRSHHEHHHSSNDAMRARLLDSDAESERNAMTMVAHGRAIEMASRPADASTGGSVALGDVVVEGLPVAAGDHSAWPSTRQALPLPQAGQPKLLYPRASGACGVETGNVHHGVDKVDRAVHAAGHHHHHSHAQLVLIGMPFFLVGMAAYFNFTTALAYHNRWVDWSVGSVVGLLSSYVGVTIHSVHVHGAHEDARASLSETERRSRCRIMLRAFAQTWCTLQGDTCSEKSFSLYCKLGILVGHFFQGYYAASSFSAESGVFDHAVFTETPWLALLCQTVLLYVFPTLVMLIEGNSEARSFDATRKPGAARRDTWGYRTILMASGCVHAAQTCLGMAKWVQDISGGCDQDDVFKNAGLLAASAGLFLIPNAIGFKSLIQQATPNLAKRFSCG